MMKKIIPHNPEAEEFVLASLFLDPSLVRTAKEKIMYHDFFDERNATIFEAIGGCFEKELSIDYLTVSNELNMNAKIQKAGGIDYLVNLTNAIPSTANFDSYLDILLDLSYKRQLIHTANKIAEKGYEGDLKSEEYIDFAEEKFFEVSKFRKASDFITLGQIAKVVRDNTERNMQHKKSVTGLHTGYETLDACTSGFQKSELIVLAARPAMGKSAIALNLALNVAEKNKDGQAVVAIFSLEMGNDQLVQRIMASKTQINSNHIRNGNMTLEEFRRLDAFTNAMGRLNVFFDDASSVTINDIRAKCRKLKKDKGLDFVVIDYLQLITGDGKQNNRQEEVSKISRSLKQMAKELEIPVLALSQLSREVEKTDDKTPAMAHLRESGSIEQDADIVFFLFRPEVYWPLDPKKGRPGEADLIIGKNRSGVSGIPVTFIFEREYSRFRLKVKSPDEQ